MIYVVDDNESPSFANLIAAGFRWFLMFLLLSLLPVCGMSSSQMTFESQTRMRSAAILVSVHRFFPATTGKFGGRMNVFDDSDDEE